MQVGFFGILAIVFITLKLVGYISWSWWLVLLPIYGGIALVIIIMVLAVLLSLLAAAIAR